MANRKLRRVAFNHEAWNRPEPLCGRWFRFDGLPEDAELVALGPDYGSNCFHAVIWSDTFEPVPVGQIIPTLEITFTVRVEPQEDAE
jgi:hypothetical protein